jgi:hypothetical protein
VRRGTLITLVVLVVVLAAAAVLQLTLASEDTRFPGPAPGTPLPSGVRTAGP